MEKHIGSDFLPFLYAKPLSQVVRPHASVPLKLRVISRVIAILTIKLVSISQQRDGADLTLDDICMLSNPLKYRSILLSQTKNGCLEEPFCPAINHRMDIINDDHGPTDSSSSYNWLSAPYHLAHSRLLPFPNTTFPAIPPPPIGLEAITPITYPCIWFSGTYSRLQCNPRARLIPIASVLRFRRQLVRLFQELWIFILIVCLTLSRWYHYRNLGEVMMPSNKFRALSYYTKERHRRDTIVLTALIAEL